MFHNKGFRSFLVVLAVFAAVLGLAVGINLARASNTAVSPSSITAAAGTAFTYQGYLQKSGSGVTDTCDFQFSLYDASTGGSQVGSTVTKNSISVSNGLFTTELDFGSSAFDGNARYLQIAVKCTGESSYTTLNGRVALNPAPYAINAATAPWSGLSGVPAGFADGTDNDTTYTAGTGLTLSGTQFNINFSGSGAATTASRSDHDHVGQSWSGSDTSGRILGAINTATTGTGAGLYGEARASGAAGVAGWNLASSDGYAVYGNNTASTGTPYGVYGLASDTGSATSYGVYGKSNSSAGSGVGGVAPTNGVVGEASNTTGTTWGVFGRAHSASGYGVYGDNTASTGTPYGVYGIASDAGNATSYGVYGKSNSSVGTGVGGVAPTKGVYGEASDTAGTTWGVFGQANSSSGYGVYGTNTNASGTGVRGDTVNGNGVAGYVDWTQSGTGVGVYGSGGFYGTAGQFENMTTSTPAVIISNAGGSSSPALVVTGTTHLEGAVTWKPVTSYLAVPPAAFQPQDNSSTFTQGGYYLAPSGASPETLFYAPVNLPHGAVITAITFHWSDNSASNNGSLILYRDNPTGPGPEALAILSTTGSAGLSSTNTTTITSPTVDNSTYSYYLELSLPDTTIFAYEIFIEYTINQPY